jgi:DNA-directed RNA polymerase subunit beta'
MMRKVRVQDPGDTLFLEDQLIHIKDFIVQNDKLYGMKVVEDAGDSSALKKQIILVSCVMKTLIETYR